MIRNLIPPLLALLLAACTGTITVTPTPPVTPPPVTPPAPPPVTYTACVTWQYDPTIAPSTACEDVSEADLPTCQTEAAIYLTPDANPNGDIQSATCYPTNALPPNAGARLHHRHK